MAVIISRTMIRYADNDNVFMLITASQYIYLHWLNVGMTMITTTTMIIYGDNGGVNECVRVCV